MSLLAAKKSCRSAAWQARDRRYVATTYVDLEVETLYGPAIVTIFFAWRLVYSDGRFC